MICRSISRTFAVLDRRVVRRLQSRAGSRTDDDRGGLHRRDVLWLPGESHRHRAEFRWYLGGDDELHRHHTWLNSADIRGATDSRKRE